MRTDAGRQLCMTFSRALHNVLSINMPYVSIFGEKKQWNRIDDTHYRLEIANLQEKKEGCWGENSTKQKWSIYINCEVKNAQIRTIITGRTKNAALNSNIYIRKPNFQKSQHLQFILSIINDTQAVTAKWNGTGSEVVSRNR